MSIKKLEGKNPRKEGFKMKTEDKIRIGREVHQELKTNKTIGPFYIKGIIEKFNKVYVIVRIGETDIQLQYHGSV